MPLLFFIFRNNLLFLWALLLLSLSRLVFRCNSLFKCHLLEFSVLAHNQGGLSIDNRSVVKINLKTPELLNGWYPWQTKVITWLDIESLEYWTVLNKQIYYKEVVKVELGSNLNSSVALATSLRWLTVIIIYCSLQLCCVWLHHAYQPCP